MLVIAMSHQNSPWAIEISLMVAFQVRDIRAIVYHNGIKALWVLVEFNWRGGNTLTCYITIDINWPIPFMKRHIQLFIRVQKSL